MKTVPLRFVAAVRTSSVDKHTHDGELPVQLCNYVDVYRKDVVRPGPDLMRATASPEEVNRFRLQVGDTVLTKDSEDPAEMGISAYIDRTADDFVCGYHLAIARPSDGTHPKFLTWVLRSQSVLQHFSAHSSGISRYGLSLSALRATPIPVKDWEEQQRIAHFLDDLVGRIDRIITARRRQVVLAEAAHLEQARVLTTQGLESETTSTNVAWMPVRGVSHHMWRIGQAFDTGSGTTPRSDKVDYYGGTIPWATTSDLRDQQLVVPPRTVTDRALTEHSALKVFPARTLLVAMYGATVGRVGLLAVPAALNQACCALQPRGPVDSVFAFSWFLSHREQIMTLASGGGQPNISQDIVRALRIPAPDEAIQEVIVNLLRESESDARRAADSLETSISLLTEYKQSLITAAVSGDLDVTTAGRGMPA